MIRLLLMALLMAPSLAFADEGRDAIAFRLTVAYQCRALTGDDKAYEDAKAAAQASLIDADVVIATVEAQEVDGDMITEQLCRDLLAAF